MCQGAASLQMNGREFVVWTGRLFPRDPLDASVTSFWHWCNHHFLRQPPKRVVRWRQVELDRSRFFIYRMQRVHHRNLTLRLCSKILVMELWASFRINNLVSLTFVPKYSKITAKTSRHAGTRFFLPSEVRLHRLWPNLGPQHSGPGSAHYSSGTNMTWRHTGTDWVYEVEFV